MRYDNAIDVVGFEQRSVCMKAFNFADGIRQEPSELYSKTKSEVWESQPRTSSKKLAKQLRRTGNHPSESYFSEWLKGYANDYGDQLPTADNPNRTEIRLPQARKLSLRFLQ